MTTTTRKKVLTLGLLVPLTIAVAACETDATVKISEDGAASISFDMRDTAGYLDMSGISSCADFESQMGEAGEFADEFSIEDISSDGQLACRFSAESGTSAIDGEYLTETDNTFILEIPSDASADALGQDDIDLLEQLGVTFTFNVEMPGDIISADGASINGNRASWDTIEVLSTGLKVEGYKTGGGSGDESAAPRTDNSGFPVWGWVLIGVGTLAVIGGFVFAVTRKKDDGGDFGGPGEGGFGGPGGPGGAGYGQPAGYGAGYSGQQGGQFDQGGYQGGSFGGQQGGQPESGGQPAQQFGSEPTQQGAQSNAYGHCGHPAPRNPAGYAAAPNIPQSGSAQGSYSQAGSQGGYHNPSAPSTSSFSRGGAEGGLQQDN